MTRGAIVRLHLAPDLLAEIGEGPERWNILRKLAKRSKIVRFRAAELLEPDRDKRAAAGRALALHVAGCRTVQEIEALGLPASAMPAAVLVWDDFQRLAP